MVVVASSEYLSIRLTEEHKNGITIILGRWDNQIGPTRTFKGEL
jgi:hypothetical protein